MIGDERAEQSVLGSVLSSRDAMDECGPLLTVDDFYVPKHGVLWDAILRVWRRGDAVDAVTVGQELGGDIERAGGATYPWELLDVPTTAASAGAHARIVAAVASKRRLAEAGDRIKHLAASDGDPVSLVEQAHAALDGIAKDQARIRWVADIMPDAIARLTARETFVPTPWPLLNRAIGGLRRGCVYVVAGRPGDGKTVVAAQMAVALAQHGTVAFSSLEMSDVELVQRMMSERLDIPVGRLKDARMRESDWESVNERRDRMDELMIAIDDRAEVRPEHIREFARSVDRKGRLAGIVVDYLQLMSATGAENRQQAVSEFSRQMKIMAKSLDVPVILLSQLNRASTGRTDPTPRLSDLRESGAIEQDCDVAILLQRQGESPDERLILNIAKNRHGETGGVELAWNGAMSRVQNIEWGGGPPPSEPWHS